MHKVWESFFKDPEKEGNKLSGKMKVPAGWLSKNIFYFHKEKEVTKSLERNDIQITAIEKFGHGKERRHDEGIWMAVRGLKNSWSESQGFCETGR